MKQVHTYKNLCAEILASHMRTEEANQLRDKLSSRSFDYVNSNLLECVVAMNKDKVKGKGEGRFYLS